MQNVFVALGSNLGDRQETLSRALEHMLAHPSIALVRASSLYETAPVGGPPQDHFLNAVVHVETDLQPDDLLAALQTVENTLDRQREIRWGPRTVDLDIIFFDDKIIQTPQLAIPHPRMTERHFVLAPLVEIAPAAIHPVRNQTTTEILNELPTVDGDVRRLNTDWH